MRTQNKSRAERNVLTFFLSLLNPKVKNQTELLF